MDPKREVQTKWHEGLQERLKGTIWHIDCGGWVVCDGEGGTPGRREMLILLAPLRFAPFNSWYKHKSGVLTSHYPGPSVQYMDEIQHPDYNDFNITKLSEMKDPKMNEISSKFGADVEKVALIGPPREPKVPESGGEAADGVAAKMASVSI